MTVRQPKIIHISCHGGYDKASKEFFLQFEKCTEGEYGIVDKLSTSRLSELLGD